MRQVSEQYKENIKKYGKQLDSKISYSLGEEEIILGSSQLNAITTSFEGSILKSVMKQIVIDSNVEIPISTQINYKFGVLVDNEYEYINYGDYIVYKVEKKEDTNSYEITAYDRMLLAMKDYQRFGVTYPITIRNYLIELCEYLQIDFANATTNFVNYDKVIQNELYLKEDGGSLSYTFRDVLDEIAQATASIICINNENKLELRYISNSSVATINEQNLKDINVNFGEKYGPINSIVLSRAGNSDNIYLKDDESIALNGLCELKISENQIMNGNDRDEYLSGILTKLDGLEYYINDFSSTGITYLELCDRYNITIGENTYSCVMFNDEVNVTQGLEELIHTDMPEEGETDYSKADKTDRRINQTYIIANKQEGEIEALVSRTDEIQDSLNNVYTKDQVNSLIINAETGVTNTFSEAGGNNIFRNTGLWFENTEDDAQQNPYEFWNGVVVKTTEDKASNQNALLLQDTTLYQQEQVPNGKYTASFKYKKLLELADVKVIINDKEYELTETEETEFVTGLKDEDGNYIVDPIEVSSQNIKIQFVSDTDDACEIYDLMVNAGSVKLAYSQNQNETTTDTVNISKGITITSSNTETTFKANSDGIRTLDNSGNVLAKFTDKGMTTKEMIVENKGEISGVLIQQIGNQTWFTKI